MCEAICGGGFTARADTLRLLTNKTLAEKASDYGFSDEHLAIIEEQNLLDVFQSDYLSAMVRGYQGELSNSELDSAACLVKHNLGDFVPDIVITYTTAPHLNQAFPDALVLHMEYGMYSRAPFPESFYLDPFGKFANSALGIFSDELRAYQPQEGESRLTAELRKTFLDEILTPRSPYRALCANLRQRHEKLLLLPLQFSGHYGFDGTCTYESQGALLQAVAETVPKDVGIVVLPHSTAIYIGDVQEKEWLDAFFVRHPNVLMHPTLSSILYPSQFMLSHVDGLASVSSSIALQGLLWGTSICALGDSHINCVASLHGLDSLKTADFEVNRDRSSHILSWLLHHYYIPGSYFFNPDWIYNYLTEGLHRWRKGVRDLSFFEPIDHPASLAGVIRDGAIPHVPIEVKAATQGAGH